MDLIGRFND